MKNIVIKGKRQTGKSTKGVIHAFAYGIKNPKSITTFIVQNHHHINNARSILDEVSKEYSVVVSFKTPGTVLLNNGSSIFVNHAKSPILRGIRPDCVIMDDCGDFKTNDEFWLNPMSMSCKELVFIITEEEDGE